MAEFVDGLSDAELRTKLAEYGFPVVPITATTRKVMTKKLKLLIENKNKTNSEGRRSLAKYSSEEESDTDVKVVKAERNRRKTVGGVMQPPVVKTRKSMKVAAKEEVEEVAAPVVEVRSSTRRTTRVTKRVEDNDFETGSDSEPEIEDMMNKEVEEPSVKSSTPYKVYGISSTLSPRVTLTKLSEDVDKTATQHDYRTDYASPKPPSTYASRYTTFSHNTDASGDSLDKLNQIRSRLSLGTSYDRPSSSYASPTSPERKYGITSSYGDGDAPIDTPFLSNFTKRLSQLSTSPKVDYSYKNDIIKEHDANGSSYNRLYLSRAKRRDYPQDFKTSQEKSIFKNNFISFALPGLFLLFFIVIFIMYIGIKTENLPAIMDTSDYILPACIEDNVQAKPGINCVPQGEITDALNLLKAVLPELTKRGINYYCGSPNVMPYMTDEHVMDHLARNYAPRDLLEVQKDINNLQVLIFKNPKWGISVINKENFPNDVQVMENMDQILQRRDSKNLSMIVLQPDIPWKCYIFNKLYTVISSLIVVGLGFLFIYGAQRGYKFYLMKQKRHNDQIYSMVEKIIDILQSNVAENNDNYLAVNHVRDMLIPPQERKQMASIWDGAVKFLAENESRVRTEIQIVSGEEFHVWRWLGTPNMNLSSSSKSKVWQGQAFETQVGSVNSLPCSPTPCLKVRGMFDKSERNHFTIREAVLSKCATKCKILHCEVDPNTDCVYLKCGDPKEAAVAYRNLHGWWCDGHLVTVKYLRLERYMQRFPESPAKGPPFLQASTTVTTNDWTNEDD